MSDEEIKKIRKEKLLENYVFLYFLTTSLSHTYVKESVKLRSTVTRVSISIHIQCPEVNFPTIQLFSLYNTAHQKLNSSRANM